MCSGVELERSVSEQIDLDTITMVVLTHSTSITRKGWPCSRPRFPWSFSAENGKRATMRLRSSATSTSPVDYGAAREQVTLVDGDHDLLGDGSIQLLLTPGHTPGHQSLCVGDQLVLGGDVTHFASGLDDHRFPVFADDFAAQASSADRLRALRDAGATVLPGHDPEVLTPGPVLP